MRTVHVGRSIPATPERVFELLADHAAYDRFRPIDASELVSEGNPAPNGVGAMRRIRVGPLRFDEEITAYEPSSRLDYLIVRLNVPFDHQGGSIRLRAEDGATHVDWTSTFRVPIPLVGGLTERVWIQSSPAASAACSRTSSGSPPNGSPSIKRVAPVGAPSH